MYSGDGDSMVEATEEKRSESPMNVEEQEQATV